MQFFKEDSGDMYDFDKLALFCILYCDADEGVKAETLFYLMASDDQISSKASKVRHIFSYLTVIACVITAEFIHSVSVTLTFPFFVILNCPALILFLSKLTANFRLILDFNCYVV